MATSTVVKNQLKLEFDNGVVEGKQKYKAKTFSNIKEEATDENLLEVSKAINALTEKAVLKTTKVVSTLIEA